MVKVMVAATGLLLLAGCRSDMQNQPYERPLSENPMYADKRSARPLVEGTVAHIRDRKDDYFYTGKIGKEVGNYLPMPVTTEMIQRGQQRYNIYCSPCHGEMGDGNGMIVQRGLKRPPSYHNERLRKAPIGYFFDVMTNGFGAMLDYSQQVKPEDRWAIAAYIRALQLSQNATQNDVPAGMTTAKEPPKGVVISAPYDTQGATPQAAPAPQGGQQ
jgi:mono/diheme cytochrome c family protein